ncbi:MAG: hypothetical protein DIKNOCCD_01325 [bacterium]|nr:hypothetical protein [bacterium]MCE7909442.1 hypothetical protein [Candidatus Omnitrophica bacterium COP1]
MRLSLTARAAWRERVPVEEPDDDVERVVEEREEAEAEERGSGEADTEGSLNEPLPLPSSRGSSAIPLEDESERGEEPAPEVTGSRLSEPIISTSAFSTGGVDFLVQPCE